MIVRVAGFDLATVSGAAILEDGQFLYAERFRPAGDTHAEIFRGFRLWFFRFLTERKIDRAAIEAPLITTLTRKKPDGSEEPMTNLSTFLVLYGLRAIALETSLRVLGSPALEVNQATWRKAFLKNGRAKKADAVALCKHLRWKVPNADAAEACGVAWWLDGHLRLSARLNRTGDLFEESAA